MSTKKQQQQQHRPRHKIVVIGLGDAGLLTAVRLSKRKHEIVAISTKPFFLSGQGLGGRITDVEEWKDQNQTNFERFRNLDHVKIVHGAAKSVDLEKRRVTIGDIKGNELVENYDVLLVATGTTNGFWRTGDLDSSESIDAKLAANAASLAKATTIAVVGGGSSAVDAASNLKEAYPHKKVHLFFPRLLPGYAASTREDMRRILVEQGVVLHPDHRADITGVDLQSLGSGTIRWQPAGPNTPPKPSFEADKIVWAVGRITPNSSFLPHDLLDKDGFVEVTPQLHHPKYPNVFAVGDICASDPNRCTARNAGWIIAATNIDRYLANTSGCHSRIRKLRSFHAPEKRWGSILGPQKSGFRIYSPSGRAFRISKWCTKVFLFPVVVRECVYKGIRKKKEKKRKSSEATTAAATA